MSLEFGARVTITSRLVREDAKWETKDFDAPRTGIFLGLRTLSDGYKDWEDYPGPRYADYTPTRYRRACLVAVNEKENPYYVAIDDVKGDV